MSTSNVKIPITISIKYFAIEAMILMMKIASSYKKIYLKKREGL